MIIISLLKNQDLKLARVNEKIKGFLKYNGFQTDSILFVPTKVKNMYRAVVNSNVTFDMNNVAKKETAKALPVLDHLKKMFPDISYIVLNAETAKAIYNTIPYYKKKKVDFKNVNSFYFDGTASFNQRKSYTSYSY